MVEKMSPSAVKNTKTHVINLLPKPAQTTDTLIAGQLQSSDAKRTQEDNNFLCERYTSKSA